MADWKFGVGSLVGRAAIDPAAVAPAAAAALLPLSNLGSGYPDEQGGLQWRSDGTYAIDFDLNLLADESERADAPTGWVDLVNLLSGTPGLPANPADWGNYGARNPALRLFRPVVQEREVMPGEQLALAIGIYRPSGAAGVTGVQVRVVDRSTGKGWDATYGTWTEDGVVAEQTTSDAWLDVLETIDADPARSERTTYLVIVEPQAAAYGATSYAYASANGAAGSPALYAEVDLCAVVGHNLPDDAVVTLDPQPAGTSLTLALAQPSAYVVGVAPQLVQTWRLSIQMPDGVQPRPELGEVWIGTAQTMLIGSPTMPIGGEERAPGQLSLVTAESRREVVPSDKPYPSAELALQFLTGTDSNFQQLRAAVARATRYGADPVLLLPGDDWDGAGRVHHGRVEDRLVWSVITRTSGGSLRSFALPFYESPFAGR